MEYMTSPTTCNYNFGLYMYEYRLNNHEGENIPHSMDTSKIAALGLPTFKSLQDMFTECIKSFQDKGFL